MPPPGGQRPANRRPTFRPSRPPSRPEPLGDILARFVARTDVFRRAGDRELREAWFDTVGEAVYRLTRLAGLRRGALTVETESAALRGELAGFRNRELLTAMNARLTGTKLGKLVVRLAAVDGPAEPPDGAAAAETGTDIRRAATDRDGDGAAGETGTPAPAGRKRTRTRAKDPTAGTGTAGPGTGRGGRRGPRGERSDG